MSLLVKCPFCPAQIKASDSAAVTTCPKCFKSFDSRFRAGEAPAKYAKREAEADDEEESAPNRVNPWGAGALILATIALFSATVFGSRTFTYTFLGLGFATVIVGMALAAILRKPANLSWLGIGATACAAFLGVVMFAPGLLHRYWTMDDAVPVRDPHLLVAVPRDAQRDAGRTLAPDEWVDGIKELIRQDDAQIRVNSVAIGPLSEKPGTTFLLVNVRFASAGNEKNLVVEGFDKNKHPPVLKDGSGKSYAFLEQRDRKPATGAIVYVAAEPHTITLGPGRYRDVQLVFEPPPGDFSPLKLELPASAYGRKGVCKFTISEPFIAPLPEVKQK